MNLRINKTLKVRISVRQMSYFGFSRNWSLDNDYNAGTMNGEWQVGAGKGIQP